MTEPTNKRKSDFYHCWFRANRYTDPTHQVVDLIEGLPLIDFDGSIFHVKTKPKEYDIFTLPSVSTALKMTPLSLDD